MAEDKNQAALNYHRYPTPGKLAIVATKNMVNQRDLSLAYSPGVADACMEIHADPTTASMYTVRGNLVAVITNGTAVLGLGSIGPLASKPVMEGKAVLFKKFADVDVFDIELDTLDIDKFVDAVALMEPTFGGINLEDIKAPECFEIERRLRERMKIPVFHDDQHGTAICVTAAIYNGLRLSEKDISQVKLVASGAGAAALACLNLLVSMGMKRENIIVCDIDGVVYQGREQMDPYKEIYAIADNGARVLDDVIEGADIFLGLSAPRVINQAQIKKMADKPFVMALANPEPEIRPEKVKEVRPDALVATGRSDYPNQVNNVLCFPFLFRGALDCGATEINETMKIACVEAIADLAMQRVSDEVSSAYGNAQLTFGPEYLIPKPFDPRLMTTIPPQIAKAAEKSGVAARPITDYDAYERKLNQFVHKSGLIMKPIFDKAQANLQRVVFAEAEARRVLSAIQEIVLQKICKPILIGRPAVIRQRMEELQLHFDLENDVEIVDLSDSKHAEKYSEYYHKITERDGVSPAYASQVVRTRGTALAALMVKYGEADAMICGVQGRYHSHLNYVKKILGLKEGISDCSAVTLLLLPNGAYFFTDTHVTLDPCAEHVAETAEMAANLVRHFGMTPRVALLSHANFGSRKTDSSLKMKKARDILAKRRPQLEVEGEMHADTALVESIRKRLFPNSTLTDNANLFVMPNLDSANITYNMIKVLAEGTPIGPILLGVSKPAHILTEAANSRAIVKLKAL